MQRAMSSDGDRGLLAAGRARPPSMMLCRRKASHIPKCRMRSFTGNTLRQVAPVAPRRQRSSAWPRIRLCGRAISWSRPKACVSSKAVAACRIKEHAFVDYRKSRTLSGGLRTYLDAIDRPFRTRKATNASPIQESSAAPAATWPKQASHPPMPRAGQYPRKWQRPEQPRVKTSRKENPASEHRGFPLSGSIAGRRRGPPG